MRTQSNQFVLHIETEPSSAYSSGKGHSGYFFKYSSFSIRKILQAAVSTTQTGPSSFIRFRARSKRRIRARRIRRTSRRIVNLRAPSVLCGSKRLAWCSKDGVSDCASKCLMALRFVGRFRRSDSKTQTIASRRVLPPASRDQVAPDGVDHPRS